MIRRRKICSAKMEDRISILPDEVLHLILSYLETKLAVQTCVLSKRWRYLWTGISTLDFDESSFSDDSSFEEFLNHVLLHRDHSKAICQFKMSYGNIEDVDITKSVIDFFVKHGRGIHDLVLSSNDIWRDFLPHSYWNLLYSWDSLKILTLEDIFVHANVDYEFVSLVTLHLIYCHLWNDDVGNDNLLNSSFKITAPQLKEFRMSFIEYEEIDPDFKMILSFPKLISFCFEGERMMPISFSQKPVLQNLDVDYVERYWAWDEGYIHLINVFGAVGGAKFVTLSYRTIGPLSKFAGVVKGNQSPVSGIEELKIIIRSSEMVDDNFSFTVPSSVLTYLLSSFPSERIKFMYKENEDVDDEDMKPCFPSFVFRIDGYGHYRRKNDGG
ncbi:F-box/LRR-repeat protein 25-like [Senna tora]|uniref:F-box/LRR-repeat protein 25-like n=1 Tax=Senna tora TaxID=362788 RepID=A0A834XE62_9FABA|nr:F-box/LRR-repeat protein 25-like [Senna tora]